MDLIGNLLQCMFIGCTRYTVSFDWVAFSAIGTFCVVVVALIPIIRKAVHRRKIREVLKDLIYVDIRDLNESFQGKLNTAKYQDIWKTEPDWNAPIPKYDISNFETLLSNYKESIYLFKKDRESIGKLIRTFKKETYHNDISGIDYTHYTYKVISKKGIEDIVKQTETLLDDFEGKEKIEID